jgi:hypothetical protein
MEETVFKERLKFDEPRLPQPWQQPNTWMVYMAAPGWTNGGEKIVDRIAADQTQLWYVRNFIGINGLNGKVKVAWLQYDPNPNPLYVESLEKVPGNFIPLLAKGSALNTATDFFIHSPATRFGSNDGPSMRYDMWLKPYLAWAKKEGNDYVTTRTPDHDSGFDDPNSEYWDHWARHWFIVNPEGQVVDAWFSNIGRMKIYAADKPINSLIHHLKLSGDKLDIPKILVTDEPWKFNYKSMYTSPYWDQKASDFRDELGMPK